MSFLTDLRAVSESVMEQVADRFSDLPRPLLAAIGAGDMAVERFAELREAIPRPGSGETPDVRALAGDLPVRAQKAAADVAGSLEQFAAQAPARAQELIAELPGRVSEIAQSLSPETVRETVEAYTHLAGVIYGNLAKRGGTTWTQMRSPGLVPGTVLESSATRSAPRPAPRTAPPTRSGAAQTAAAAPAAVGEPVGVKVAAAKAEAKAAAAKAAGGKPAGGKPAAARTGTAASGPTIATAGNPAATKPAAPARVAPKTAGRRPPIPKGPSDTPPAG